jgi:hypothetical protein
MHLTPDIWSEVCRFFRHPAARREPVYSVKIHQFGRRLLPVQALTVWHALQEFNGLAGSLFIAHVMGIGKTTIAFAIHWVQHLLNYMWDQIQKDLLRNADSHSSQEEDTVPLDKCPSNTKILQRYGLDCPCASSSPTHFAKAHLGATIALAPLGLLSVWEAEGAECFPKSKNGTRHPVQVLRAHGATTITPRTKDLLLGDEETCTIDLPGGGTRPADSNYWPRLQNSHVFVVTTSQSLQTRFLNVFRAQVEWTETMPATTRTVRGASQTVPSKTRTRKNVWHNTAVVSMVFRDECHLESRSSSPSIGVLRTLRSYQAHIRTRIVPLSGTAITVGPREAASWIQLMVQDDWSRDQTLKDWMGDECVDLGARWERLCTGTGDQAELGTMVALFQPLVERLFIRFTNSSDFLGYPPAAVPKSIFRTIECENDPDWAKRIEALKEDEDQRLNRQEKQRRQTYADQNGNDMRQYVPLQRNRPSMYITARLCASFPYLMQLRHGGQRLTLTQTEWQRHVRDKLWKGETSTDPYFSNLQDIVKSSGKLKELGKLLDYWERREDGEKKLARQIFCSYFHVGAYIIYLVGSMLEIR